MKIRSGALFLVLLLAGLAGGCSRLATQTEVCGICGRPLHGQTEYKIRLRDGKTISACCTRCGLHFQRDRQDVVSAEVADYSSGQLLPAKKAFYVEGSRVQLCLRRQTGRDRSGGQYSQDWDRCLPSLIAFRDVRKALAFQHENGGFLRSYKDLLLEEPAVSPPASPGG